MDQSTAENLFGLEGEYGEKEIRSAYKRLALKYHLDRNDSSPESTFFMKQINEAYELLLEGQGSSASSTAPGSRRTSYNGANAARNGAGSREGRQESTKSRYGWGYQETRYERHSETERNRWDQKKQYGGAKRDQQTAGQRKKERKAREKSLEEDYRRACDLSAKARSLEDHRSAVRLFNRLGKYKDSEVYCALHEGVIARYEAVIYSVNRLTTSTIAASAVAVLFAMGLFQHSPLEVGFALFFSGIWGSGVCRIGGYGYC